MSFAFRAILKMQQDGNTQIGGQLIYLLHLRAISGDTRLQFTETNGSVSSGVVQQLNGIGTGDIDASKQPHSARRLLDAALNLILLAALPRITALVTPQPSMFDLAVLIALGVEMNIQNGAAPLRRLREGQQARPWR